MKDIRQTTGTAKWYHYDQNNSGGYCIRNDDVGDDVFIQAYSAEQANEIFSDISEDYNEYCQCCGERWYYCDEGDGTDLPSKYGKSILDGTYATFYSDGYAILYGINGRKAKISRQGIFELESTKRIE